MHLHNILVYVNQQQTELLAPQIEFIQQSRWKIDSIMNVSFHHVIDDLQETKQTEMSEIVSILFRFIQL